MQTLNTSQQVLDELLVIQVQGGKLEAWNLLVKRWHSKLLRQANRHTRNMEASRDIVQESWQIILKDVRHLQDPSRFGVWALTITNRRSFSWVRKQQKDRAIMTSQIAEISNEVEDQVDITNLLPILQKNIQLLPDNQRLVIAMFYLEGHSIEEIAKILDVPPGTVKSRLYHAREHLKNTLKTKDYEK